MNRRRQSGPLPLLGVAIFVVGSAMPDAGHAESAQEAYATWCGRCHQFDGTGIPGSYPALDGSAIVTADGKLLARLVLDGGFPNNAMPAFRDALDDELAATILTYLRISWSNKASPVTAADVAARNTP